MSPISRSFGADRGRPVDRYWIEGFLEQHAELVRGRVLEFGDDDYTRRFGLGDVEVSEVLYPKEGKPGVTLVADLAYGTGVPWSAFDCIICTQTLQYIYDVSRAVATLYGSLKSGGALLMTVPGISPICRVERERWGEYWRFTTDSVQRLLEGAFPSSAVTVRGYGNVLAATAFLHGLAAEELRQEELEHFDRDYEIIIAACAIRPVQ